MLEITNESIPLRVDADGVVRVPGTRIPLDSIVALFDEGSSAEHIVEQLDTLALGDVYAILAYCIRHRAEVDAYLASRHIDRQARREAMQRRFPTAGLRERLLRRREEQDSAC